MAAQVIHPFLSASQFAESIGASRVWVARRIADGTIASVRVAGLRRIPASELDRLEAQAMAETGRAS